MVKDAGLPGSLSISGTVFFIFVERHQLFENLEKEPNLVEDAGMPGSSVISWTIIVEKTSTNLVKSEAHLGKFQSQPTNNDNKREKV